MGRLVPPGWQPLSDTGAVMPSATATWSRTGTATAKNTYSNKALSSANANPVVADASGRFGAIFGLEDEGYRLVLKNAAGTTIYTLDEVFAESAAVDELLRRKEIIRSPFDHSAVGDGSTNDATALAAALLAADGVLDLEGKTYRCDSSLALRSGITIKNGTLDFSQAAASAGLQGAGSANATTVVTSATIGGQTITAAGHSGYVAGDLLRLRSADTIAAGHTFAELFRVEGTSGNDILVDGAILGTYTTTPLVEEITPITDIRLEDLTIISPSGGYAIDLDLCERVHMQGVSVRCTGAAESIRVLNCYGVVIESCSIRQKTTTEAGGIIVGNASRDVLIDGCHIERALQAIEIGDDYGSYDGLTRDVRVIGCRLTWCGQIEIAEGARYVCISNNTMGCDISPSVASTPAILIGGADVIVSGNTIRDPEGPHITITPLVSGGTIDVIGNKLSGGETHSISVTSTAFTIQSLRINDNEVSACVGDCITMAGTTFTSIEISRNTLRDGTGTNYVIYGSNVTYQLARILNNVVEAGTTYAGGISFASAGATADRRTEISGNTIYCEATTLTQLGIATAGDDLSICSNWISSLSSTGGPDTGISVSSTVVDSSTTRGGAIISGNAIRMLGASGTGTAGIEINSSGGSLNNLTISDNDIITSAQSVAPGIRLLSTITIGFVSINGNRIRTTGDGIYIAADGGGSKYIISGNNIVLTSAVAARRTLNIVGGVSTTDSFAITGNVFSRNADDGVNVEIADIDGCTFSGNVFVNGTYGIQTNAPATGLIHDGNVFVSQATAATNGAFDTAGDQVII